MTLRSAAGVSLPLLIGLTALVAWEALSGPPAVRTLAGALFMPLAVSTCAALQFLIVHARSGETSWWMLLWIPVLGLAGVAVIGGTCVAAISGTPPESNGYLSLGVGWVLLWTAVVWAFASGLLFVFELVRLAMRARSTEPS